MGNWSDGRGWRDASTESSVMAGVYGGTAFLGRAGHWITSLLLPSEMAYSRTLGELSDVACVSTSRSCSLLRGTIKDTSLTLFVDPKTRLINTIDLEDPNVNAHIKYDPVADPSLDFNRIAAQVKEAPDRWLSFSAIVQRTV
ncbi:MAG: hypothetical protein ACRETX_01885 [Steroidobacteraceae bacterium]